MSLSLLLEKYDVSTDEGLAKALGEIEKEEAEVDEALSNAMSRACTLEGQLHSASQAYTKLAEVKSDAQTASNMVDKTAALAKDVSAKVRQLDLARSRVAECQRRVHDLIDLQLCSAGVEAAINANDYETGAGHVARFLGMAPGSLAAARARGAADPRAAMDRAARTLRDLLRTKFEEAARKDDTEAVERLFKLFPQIGCAEEGVDLLAKYLAAQVEAESRSLPGGGAGGAGGAAAGAYAAALSRLLEAAARAAERARRAAAAAPGHLPRALRTLQPAVCAAAGRVYRELVAARGLSGPAGPASGAAEPAQGALAAEPALEELAAAHHTVLLYCRFLRRAAQADAAPLDDQAKEACKEATDKIISECDLTRTAQDILGHYLKLERYFLEENVNKALKMAAPQPGVTSSSLVDDLFFIARKAISRSVRTGSVEGVCAVLNEAAAGVERGAGWLRRAVSRAVPPPLPPPPSPPPTFAAAAVLTAEAPPSAEALAQRDLFLAHMSEASAGAEWSVRLAEEARAAAAPLAGGDERALRKLASVAGGLGAADAAYRGAAAAALAALHAAAAPRRAAWAKYLAAPAPPDEMEEDAAALPQALDAMLDELRPHLPASLLDSVMLETLADLATRAENQMLHNYYDREGGLGVERRARRLAGWAGGAASAARERLARLAAAAALLALERPQHAAELRPPPHAAALLARRTDFKIEEIKRLKL